MMEIFRNEGDTMKTFDYETTPEKLLTPELVKVLAGLQEHKGKQELFLEANADELKTLLEVAKSRVPERPTVLKESTLLTSV